MSSSLILENFKKLIPPLNQNLRKGQAGRVAVFGGSIEYTGAPYFAGSSALRAGVDIAHIICEESAATAIKGYSPDLIVHPYLKAGNNVTDKEFDEVKAKSVGILDRVHSIVIGPGLSRDEAILKSITGIIHAAKERSLPIVIDGDGLFLIQNSPDIILGYKKAVLTPNFVEFQRLCKTMNIDPDKVPLNQLALKLSQEFQGVAIVQKGSVDYITDGSQVYECNEQSGLKRCGGQGDILAGLTGAFLSWGSQYHQNTWKHDNSIASDTFGLLAGYAACYLTRKCSKMAYDEHKRATMTENIIKQVGPAFNLNLDAEKNLLYSNI
ncbi:carbohydrate kinase [Conidiobolus coronatus NRRL 28638]|uniref:ATP-dependent (S)-NAD(P)H-hydrate dehydratase n=1 Tax=Conidiobolus coronatus (strain ATCC 28846 / CBS 209.66 / NRRL 28638) TaxID=796925 RepID=A0A137P6B1_CONC2|nr:carbohydrate kinase [Conidiobolus coronatus NRRL 28638]|eukprot:KXN70538.1 carbohydrate kinase [Conidiobolus coronatus NRRL 28638]